MSRLAFAMEELIRRTVGPEILVLFKLTHGLWLTLCDPNLFESALLNLVINARDAMPDGGRLLIETANTVIEDVEAAARNMAPGDYVTLSVADTGTGMLPTVAARAFDPFFTTKPVGKGTGLGLSMIYDFVKQLRGDVRLQTSEGEGTALTILLPRYVTVEKAGG